MTTNLSTEVFSHRLKIKWDNTRYITRNLAENIFLQLTDEEKKTIVIVNHKTLTYVHKYKSEVELTELVWEDKTFEDTLHHNWFKEHQKDYIREIWKQRKKDNKSTSNTVLQAVIESYKRDWFVSSS